MLDVLPNFCKMMCVMCYQTCVCAFVVFYVFSVPASEVDMHIELYYCFCAGNAMKTGKIWAVWASLPSGALGEEAFTESGTRRSGAPGAKRVTWECASPRWALCRARDSAKMLPRVTFWSTFAEHVERAALGEEPPGEAQTRRTCHSATLLLGE